jgi:hypothetical protein
LSGSDDKLKFAGHSAGTFGPIHCIPKRSQSIPEKLKYFMRLPGRDDQPDRMTAQGDPSRQYQSIRLAHLTPVNLNA